MTDSPVRDTGVRTPTPGSMPMRQYAGEPTSTALPEIAPQDVTARIADLLDQVDEVAAFSDDSFDLAALERQTRLLEQAHESLTAALDAVDRR